MNDKQNNENNQSGILQRIAEASGFGKVEDKTLEMIGDPPENRGNRFCVSISDIHLTDGTVGFQNLSNYTWDAFYGTIRQHCINYHIDEVVLVLDGDIVDMIRSSKWAENNIYPWQRKKTVEFSSVVNTIIKDIVEKEHSYFFNWLQNLEKKLKDDDQTNVKHVKIVVLLGNHDKELFCDQQALNYFYEKGLGRKISKITKKEREGLSCMYSGGKDMFTDTKQAPYLPFYYGDKGFRFFTTHGQWRDKDNSNSVKAKDGKPGWTAIDDGWNIETWQQLKFSPFLLPCFGDTVAAGVLSTFIYKVKKKLKEAEYKDQRLNCILDELDLYRPTYAAVTRILDETSDMRTEERKHEAIKIIEETLYECITDWLSWPYTYQSSPFFRCVGLKLFKRILETMKSLGHGLEITAIAGLMRTLAFFNRYHRPGISFSKMKKFPSFMPAYRHYKFQIHGEGHTHQPLQEEPNFSGDHPSTYINFGTWRDQILPRKKHGYRRRGVLRALFILDIVNKTETAKEMPRSFDYFVEDVIHWGDFKDAMGKMGRAEPKT